VPDDVDAVPSDSLSAPGSAISRAENIHKPSKTANIKTKNFFMINLP
jgi:hypothetical protein